MIHAAAFALALTLAQDPDPAAPAQDPAPQAQDGQVVPPTTPVAPVGPPRPKGADDVARALAKIQAMPPEERSAALDALQKQFGSVDSNPVLPTNDVDLERYVELTPVQQAEVAARGFLTDLLANDDTRLVLRAGYPFFMESRRIDRPEELRTQWSRALRSRRSDLLKLYSIEVLSPADMEKKYGKPPARLNAWGLKSGTTFLAVANMSGHATILLLRQAGAAWQVVGFHD